MRPGLEGRQVHVAEEVRVIGELKLLHGDAVTAQSHGVLGPVDIWLPAQALLVLLLAGISARDSRRNAHT